MILEDVLSDVARMGSVARRTDQDYQAAGYLVSRCLDYLGTEGQIIQLPCEGGLENQPWDLMGLILDTANAFRRYLAMLMKPKKGKAHGR